MKRLLPNLGIALLTLLLCLLLVFVVVPTDSGSRMAFDEAAFHAPTILHFVRGGSLGDYPSATAPGYHLLMAGLVRAFGASIGTLRLAGAVGTALLVLLLSLLWSRATTPQGAWLALPAVTSLYVLPSGAWLLPDNLAWITVLSVLWLTVLPAWRWPHVLAVSALAASCVIVRQSNAWVVAPVAAAVWFGAGKTWAPPLRIAVGACATLPALLTLAGFAALWGGLTPPAFQERHQAVNLVAPSWFLVQFSACGVFYLPAARRVLRETLQERSSRIVTALAAGLGLAISLAVPSAYDPPAGRWSGLWNIVRLVPAPFGRSLLVVAGCVLGAALLALWLRATDAPRRTVLLASVCGFCAAQVANRYAFDKYYFGYVIMLLALLASCSRPRAARADAPGLLGTGALAALNATVLAAKILE